MTKMAAVPICGKILSKSSFPEPSIYDEKNFENLLLQNHKSDDLETWHSAKGPWALQILYKRWPLVDLDLFCNKVNFVQWGFYIGKVRLHFQTASPQTSLDRLKLDFIWNIYASSKKKVYITGSSPMTNLATMPIYGKNPLKIFSGTISQKMLETAHSQWDLSPTKFV